MAEDKTTEQVHNEIANLKSIISTYADYTNSLLLTKEAVQNILAAAEHDDEVELNRKNNDV